jgi:glycogen debranching enzyme
MSDSLVQILDGNTFVVSDRRGDIEASLTDPSGLFSFDTRFLSRWVLTVNGERLSALSTDELGYFETQFTLVPGTGTVYLNATQTVTRHRVVANGFSERLEIQNHANEPVELTVRIDAACDFADLFEVKDAMEKKGEASPRVDGSNLVLAYQRETFTRATVISSSPECDAIDENGLTFEIEVPPHDTWIADIDVSIAVLGSQPADVLTPSVNLVQSAFPEAQQGEISGLSRCVSNLGSSLGTAVAGTILVSGLDKHAYAGAMIVLAVLAVAGLGAAIMLPKASGSRT